MKVMLRLFLCCIASLSLHAQVSFTDNAALFSTIGDYTSPFARKLYQRNYGVILGVQRGKSTAFEFGGEAHWRKISLRNPRILGATVNMGYNFADHVIGYQAGMWAKQGRINFTYGANVSYYNNFKGLQRYGIGPAIGFRLAGFHLINGYNFLAGDKELDKVNTLYITLRYYFPLQNKFTWDRKTMKKKRERRREKEKRIRQREKEAGEEKGIRKLFHLHLWPKKSSGTAIRDEG